MKVFKKLAMLTLTSVCISSWAAGDSEGFVTNLFIHSPGILMFKAGLQSGAPACSIRNEWAISLALPEGKSMYALLLSAQAQGKTVLVHSYESVCSDWPDRLRPNYIMLVE